MTRIRNGQQGTAKRSVLFTKRVTLLLGVVTLFLIHLVVQNANKSSPHRSGASLRLMTEVFGGSGGSQDYYAGEFYGRDDADQEEHDTPSIAMKEPFAVVPPSSATYKTPYITSSSPWENKHNGDGEEHEPPSIAIKEPIAVVPSSSDTYKTPYIASSSPWKNKRNVVHVLNTRFMQLQPDLMHLGKARMELFKTFTLRSIREQSTQEFMWLIFTDPKLAPELLKELVDLVKIHRNILLVGSNERFGGLRDTSKEIDRKSVFSGDYELYKSYQKAAQTHVYVESRIDADDSMFVGFMETMQKQAARALVKKSTGLKWRPDNDIALETSEFRVFCAWHSLEWGYFNPWNKESTKGHLFGITSPEFCITAGLTYAFQIGTNPKKVQKSHFKLDKVYPQCNEIKNTNCIDRVDAGNYKYSVLRSRTPTSAGMAGVIPTEEVVNSKEWENMQDKVWVKYIMKNFGAAPRSIWATRAYLSNNMESILQDALSGQCSRAEFSCKQASKDSLANLLNEVNKYSSNSIKSISSSSSEKAAVEMFKPTI